MVKVRYKFNTILKLSVVFVFSLFLVSCAKNDGLGAFANSIVVQKPEPKKEKPKPKEAKHQESVISSKTKKAQTPKSNNSIKQNTVKNDKQRKGFFAWLFSSSNQQKHANNKEGTVQNKNTNKTNNSLTKGSNQQDKINKKDDKVKNNPKKELQIVEAASASSSSGYKDSANNSSFLKWTWNKIVGLVMVNSIQLEKIPYKEDSIRVENNLNMVVLRVPNTDELNKKEDKAGQKHKETKLTVEKLVPKDDLYSGFDIKVFDSSAINNTQANNQIKVIQDSKNIKKDNNKEEIYKDYIIALKYEGIFSNYNNVNTIDKLTTTHKKLINNLLIKVVNKPKVIYVVYRNTNDINDDSSVKNQLYLTNYLNLIRSYIYTKGMDNIFVQELQFKNLPVNQVLLILKPITIEQFKNLPKQLNIYNAPKISSKSWIDKVNNLEKEKSEKQKQLYNAAQGN